MIIGHLKDIKKYKGIHQNLDTAIDYLTTHNLFQLPLGQTKVDDDRVYINRFNYETLDKTDCILEGHKNFIDIHLILSGEECLGASDITALTPLNPYDNKSDFTAYSGELTTKTHLTFYDFAICFPEDAHMPKMRVKKNDSSLVDKVVVKIKN